MYGKNNPPPNDAEALRRRVELTAIKNDIELQLADRNRIDSATGERLGCVDYHQWRSSALGALRAVMSEINYITLWRKEQQLRTGQGAPPAYLDSLPLLTDALQLIKKLARQGGTLDSDDRICVEALETYITAVTPVAEGRVRS